MKTVKDALAEFDGEWKYEYRDQLWVCTKPTIEFSEGSFCYASAGQMELDGQLKAPPYWSLVCSREEFESAKRQDGNQ